MGIKSTLAKPFAKYVRNQQQKWILKPIEAQERCLKSIVKKAQHTVFGKDHRFGEITNYNDFREAVPIADYEQLRPYIDRVTKGEPNILWPGKPLYLAKTSGTTSGVKYIPITRDSIHNHIDSARNALLNYIDISGNSEFLNHYLIFLSGSPVLEKKSGIYTGRLSGISNHHVPAYLRSNQLPSYETNIIEDWETKLERIVDETINKSMGLISGIPPWVQMYFDVIQRRTGRTISELFPDFSLFVYGGVNFEPYKAKLYESIGKKVDSIELFPASEGFFAYQDQLDDSGLLLLLDTGIFYEFVPIDEIFDANPKRLSISEVELDKNYAMIINSNAGLWGYNLGDTVRFVSLNPFRVVVSGRVKHFISAFGEHVIGEEVEKAMKYAIEKHPEVEVTEFSVAPMVTPKEGLPYHEWLIEFAREPNDMQSFAKDLDDKMVELNTYYRDLIEGSILRPLKITSLPKNSFINYMRKQGKLGGQNKVPRLSNDRKIADAL